MSGMEIVSSLALALGAGWCSGINLYATVGVLGLLHRYTAFDLPGGMEVLGNDMVVWPALILYCIEFVADKVPAVDSAWDAIHTFIRVPAGAVLAAMALGDVPMEMQILAGLVGGTLALGSHVTKATTRLVAHGTGTSPVLSPVVSVIEDVVVIGTVGLVASNPLAALALLAAMMVAAYFLVRTFWRVARKAFRALFGMKTSEDKTATVPMAA